MSGGAREQSARPRCSALAVVEAGCCNGTCGIPRRMQPREAAHARGSGSSSGSGSGGVGRTPRACTLGRVPHA